MRDEARQVLVRLIKEHGTNLANHPDKFRGLFLDFAPWQLRTQHPELIEALIVAGHHGVIQKLTTHFPTPLAPGSLSSDQTTLMRRIIVEYQELSPQHIPHARWACESWAVALELINESQTQQPNAPASPPPPRPSPTPPKPAPPTPYTPPPPRPAPQSPPKPQPAQTPAPALTSTKNLIQGCVVIAVGLLCLDGAVWAMTSSVPSLLDAGLLVIFWLGMVYAIWLVGYSIAGEKAFGATSLPRHAQSIVFLLLSHYALSHVFEISYPGGQFALFYILHLFFGLGPFLASRFDSPARKLLPWVALTLVTITLDLCLLDVSGRELGAMTVLWVFFLTFAWSYPMIQLNAVLDRRNQGILKIWLLTWSVIALAGQWLVPLRFPQNDPKWAITILTAFHLWVAWMTVWLLPLRSKPWEKYFVQVLFITLGAAALACALHPLFRLSW
jgi:hypothetical protein